MKSGESGRTPPGPGALGSVRLALRLLRDPRGVLEECTGRYGPVWRLVTGADSAMVMLMGPQGNERVLSPQYKDDFSWYEGYQLTMKPLFGRDILFLLDDTPEDPAHRLRHRTLIPAFHPRLDDDYTAIMRDIAASHFARWTEGTELDLAWELKRITFHIVARLFFGAKDEDLLMLTRLFEELGHGLFTLWRVPLPGFRFRRGLLAHRQLSAYVRARIAEYRQSDGPPANMLGQLMRVGDAAGERLPDEVLIGEVLAFLFAGYDTTSSLLISLWAGLAERPDWYLLVRDEARALRASTAALGAARASTAALGAARASTAALGAARADRQAAMPEQRHLEAALAEAERLFPPLTFALRGVLRDFSFGGYDIKAGSQVAYSAYYTGRMAEVFERPGAFRPERFLAGSKVPPYAIVGFGGGHRSCIGKRFALLEMRLIINLILQHFDVEFLPGRSDEVFFNPAMQRRHGFPVRLHRLADS